ncbi:MAG: sporulation protein YqfD [Clostridia bacterium]|nr:sporulation protein YqfD [Clostridia bacterium]
MYVKVLIYYICGYVNVVVEGFFIERFINMCISKRIFFWNTARNKSTVFSANIGVRNYKEVVKIAKKCQCKIKIKRKSGLPFLLNRYRKRKIFAIALILIVIVISTISNFIWNVEITGVEDSKQKEILEFMQSNGVKVGSYKKNIDLQSLINKIRIEREDIAWLGMEIKGTNLIVKIVEADEKPEIIDENEYCNIVAKKDGIITKVEAQNGTPIVVQGDTVKKGDVLVEGWIEGNYTENRYVHAEGTVIAKVWYSEKEKVYYNQSYENQTGNKEKKYSININNFKINFFKTLSKFEKYDTISTIKKLKITSNFYLPVEIIVNENYEKQENQVVYDKNEAKEIGINNLKNKLHEQIQNEENISNIYINTNEAEDYIEVEVIYEVLESIGTKEKL